MNPRLFLLLLMVSTCIAKSENVVVHKSAAATTYTEASRAHFGVWTDSEIWKPNPHPSDLFKVEFLHTSGELIGILNAERTIVPSDSLPVHALENGRAFLSNLNLVSQEHRIVCGKIVLYLVMEGSINNRPGVMCGYYYTGPEGTVQLIAAFEKKDEEVYKSVAIDFLNGLQLGQVDASNAGNHPEVPSAMPAATGITNVDINALNASVPYRVNDPAKAKMAAILTGNPATVAKRLQAGVDKKDPVSMYFLAHFYAQGRGVAQSPDRAVDLLKQAVAANLPAAGVALGSWYASGYQVPKDLKEAERLYRKAAEAGLPEADSRLGEILLPGDPKAGADFLRKAAVKGFARAEYLLAFCYRNGTGVEKNLEEEITWLRKASSHGSYDARETLGECYLTGHGVPEDHVEAVKLFREAAKAGVPVAQNNLGCCLLKGDGTPADREEAVDLFQKAAEKGVRDAQRNLGDSYVHGIGVTKDVKQGVYWYEKAAKQGSGEAEFWTGIALLNGEGTEKNLPMALEWLRKAADQNIPLAFYDLGAIYLQGNGVQENKAEGVMWFRKGAEAGDARSQDALASCYFRGIGVEKDDEQAVKWFRKAAQAGVATAQLNLGLFSMNGIGKLSKNVNEGVEWIRKAAEQGESKAEFMFGVIYSRGTGVDASTEEAARWFRLSAIHGNPFGQNAFGYMLATGEGVKRDIVEAYKWYLLAMAQNEAEPKARAKVNKDALLPTMTAEEIREGEKRASDFVPVKEKKEEADPFSIDAA